MPHRIFIKNLRERRKKGSHGLLKHNIKMEFKIVVRNYDHIQLVQSNEELEDVVTTLMYFSD
jgi:hypothetical protein